MKSIVCPPFSVTVGVAGVVVIAPICQSSSTIVPVPTAVAIAAVLGSVGFVSSGVATGVCSVTVSVRSSSGVVLALVGTEMLGTVVSPLWTSNEPLPPSLVV